MRLLRERLGDIPVAAVATLMGRAGLEHLREESRIRYRPGAGFRLGHDSGSLGSAAQRP